MLQNLIESLTKGENNLEISFRQLRVVAHRTNSDQLKQWVESEVGGYREKDEVPDYRRNVPGYLKLNFTGYGGYSRSEQFTEYDIPHELWWWDEHGHVVRQSVVELAALCEAANDPVVKLPNKWVARYQALFDEGRASGYAMMMLDSAYIVLPRTALKTILGKIHDNLLKLALELESISPELGRAEGVPQETATAANAVINLYIDKFTGDLNTGNMPVSSKHNAGGEMDFKLSNQFNMNAGNSTNYQGNEGEISVSEQD